MRPKKKRAGRAEQPDAVLDEIPDTLGGTDGEEDDDEERARAEVGQGGGYGREREQGDERDPF